MAFSMNKLRAFKPSQQENEGPRWLIGEGVETFIQSLRQEFLKCIRNPNNPDDTRGILTLPVDVVGNSATIGPHWIGQPESSYEEIGLDKYVALLFFNRITLFFLSWREASGRLFPSPIIDGDTAWTRWVDALRPRLQDEWRKNGILGLINLSTEMFVPDHDLLASSLAFWNSSRNSFDFKLGPASLTLLDIAVVFGLRVDGRAMDLLNDYQHIHSNPNLETKVTSAEKILEKEFGTIKSYSKQIPYIIQKFSKNINQ